MCAEFIRKKRVALFVWVSLMFSMGIIEGGSVINNGINNYKTLSCKLLMHIIQITSESGTEKSMENDTNDFNSTHFTSRKINSMHSKSNQKQITRRTTMIKSA